MEPETPEQHCRYTPDGVVDLIAGEVGEVGLLGALAIEHAMRVCTDEALVWRVRTADARSRVAAAVLSRIQAHCGSMPEPGTPLRVWAVGGNLHPMWRRQVPTDPDGVFAELARLRRMELPAERALAEHGATLLEELNQLRGLHEQP